ncbi:hypothetical protein F4604DRAFT_1919006 [Suillus subluteus]|nr:hypothetical protein F4604DRAFT_1919006 [Suillus subluteus]
MVKSWALEVELMEEHNDDSDLDKPYAAIIKKNLSKKDRTGCAALRYAQSTICLRECFAKYLDDQTPTALHCVATKCCDRHPNDDFDLSQYFLGWMYTSEDAHTMPSTAPAKRKRTKLRDKALHKPSLKKLKK